MIEVAYLIPGEQWKRRSVRSEDELNRFLDQLEEKYGDCIEYRVQS